MAWTAPRTWVAGEIVTAAIGNTHWRDQFLFLDAQAENVVTVVYEKATPKDVNTTVAATDLLNGEVVLPANLLGTTRKIRVEAFGDWLNNTGGALAPPRLQLLLGATTLIDTGVAGLAVGASATRGTWTVVFEIANQNAANVQFGWLRGTFTAPGALTTGVGGPYANQSGSNMQEVLGSTAGTVAVDTTVNQNVLLKTINPSNSANYSTRLQGASVELV